MIILVYFLDWIIIYKNMKNKKNNKIISYSGFLNNSNNNFSLISQDISYQGEKNEYSNKKIKPYYYRKKKSRQINSLDEITKKFMKCVLEAESNTINLNTVMKKIKVKKRRIYDITNVLEGKLIFFYLKLYFLGIGLIKKASKNQITLKPNFYDFYFNKDKNKIELNEENNKENVNKMKIQVLNKEINDVNYYIEHLSEKILCYKEKNNEKDKINTIINDKWKSALIPCDELLKFIYDKDKNVGLFVAKSESELKVELAHINEPKNIMVQKKSEMNYGKLQYNKEYLNLCCFSNRLYIISNNNSPINLFKIDSKSIKFKKEKDEINNFYYQNENDNLLNNNNLINSKNNENKCEINFNLFKNNLINKKDLFISDIASFGNINSFNPEINYLFNSGIV